MVGKQLLFLFLAFFLVGLIGHGGYLFDYSTRANHDATVLRDGWNIRVNGSPCESNSLDELVLPIMGRGDTLDLQGILPKSLPDHPLFVFYNIHSTLRVQIDGKERYRYGQEEYEAGKMIGYGYQYIPLTEEDAGKSLEISMVVTENEAFSSQKAPMIVSGDHYFRDLAIQNRLQLTLILFLALFGVLVFVVALHYSRRGMQFSRLLYVGAFSTTIGIWSLASTNLLMLFTYDLRQKVLLEYGSLFLAPIFVFAYFGAEIREEGRTRWLIYRVLMGTMLLFVSVSYLLQITEVVHFPAMLKYCHILMACAILFLAIRFVVDLFRGISHGSVLTIGFEVLTIFTVTDLIRYNIQKFVLFSVEDHFVSMVYVGMVFFVVALILDFAERSFELMYQKAADDALSKLAYTDALTGLANRRSCEIEMDKIMQEKKEYLIFGFDLNDLKKVNDGLGHEEGDLYLKTFGSALLKVFSGCGTVGRTGGDEYTVIVPEAEGIDPKGLLSKLQDELERINRDHESWTMSAAYGYCSFEEASDVYEASRIADQRMYEKKAEMKQNGTGKN